MEVSTAQDSKPYMSKLNEEYWLGAALEDAKEYDIFFEKECQSDEEVYFIEDVDDED